MSDYLHLFSTTAARDAVYNGSGYTEPWVSLVTATDEVDYNKEPLTFKILTPGSIRWQNYGYGYSTGVTIQYSKNDSEWTSITSAYGDENAPSIIVAAGDILKFKGSLSGVTGGTTDKYTKFVGVDCDFIVSGDILSLCQGQNYLTVHTFEHLFSGCNIIQANKLKLPAELKAGQFYDTFSSCRKLILPPKLPFTNLYRECYANMFACCTSMTTAPELPATELATECYRSMFYGCSNLSSVTCLATDISASNCISNWLSGVSSTGTFIKAASMSSWPSGASGIPENWTIVNAS